MSKCRRHFTADQKGEIVRRHSSVREPVSNLAELLPDEWLKTHPEPRRRWSR